ncbi:MAG: DMT family transporter [Candidatus Latescibacteria bacterium]|nr:DMT family transporter [Candidatus Latescibacterota bacterium]
MKTQKRAYLYAISAVLLWSTAASAFKLTLRYTVVLPLLLYSSLVSLIVFFAALLFQGKFILLRSCTRQDILISMSTGFLNPFLYYVVLFKAYSMLPAQQAMTLNYTWPVMLVILSIPLLRQKITVRSFGAIILSFCGVIVIGTQGNITSLRFSSPTGVLLATGSSVIWSFFWIFNIRDNRDEIVKLFLGFLFGTVFIVVFSQLASGIKLPCFPSVFGMIYIGLFEMGITFILWLKALKLSDTTARVGNLVYLSPFLSLFFIHIVVGETIAITTFIGLVMIMSGIVLQQKAN